MSGPAPLFQPTSSVNVIWQSLLDWLALYEMSAISNRLRAGTFWRDPAEQLRLIT